MTHQPRARLASDLAHSPGDLVGQGVSVGIRTFGGESVLEEADWVYTVNAPGLGGGLFAWHQVGEGTPDGVRGTGEVIGLAGVFTDLIGTLTIVGSSTDSLAGTYVIELQPAEPSPTSSEPTDLTRT